MRREYSNCERLKYENFLMICQEKKNYLEKYIVVDDSVISGLLNVVLTPCNLVKNKYQSRISLIEALIVRSKLAKRCYEGKKDELIHDDFVVV